MEARVVFEVLLSHVCDRVLLRSLPRSSLDGRVVLLIFHSVTSKPRFKIDSTPEHLANTIDAARDCGYEVVSLPQAVARLRSGEMRGNCVVLTFDDGYKDFLTCAAPVLRDLEAPGTVSILPHYVESQEPFQFESGADRYSMSWSELRQLERDHGDLITIANHSNVHADFSQLSVEEALQDVDTSQRAILDNLGFAPRYFTYPFGKSNATVRGAVQKRFEAILGGTWAPNLRAEDVANLNRIAVLRHDSRPTLVLKAAGRATAYQVCRDAAKKLLGRS